MGFLQIMREREREREREVACCSHSFSETTEETRWINLWEYVYGNIL